MNQNVIVYKQNKIPDTIEIGQIIEADITNRNTYIASRIIFMLCLIKPCEAMLIDISDGNRWSDGTVDVVGSVVKTSVLESVYDLKITQVFKNATITIG